MPNLSPIPAPQDQWRTLAQAHRDRAAYQASRGEYAGVSHAKADACEAAAKSLDLEREHGEPYCSCHLKPMKLMQELDANKVRRH